ncbi:Scr1 family TA system antitoxin-like transcriptional regulator [Streptomyces xiamenensis]|uniref:Scr1 family TA system antitoxin-like transcriptional regulator n=1 Tax=Streptomyces xiamenensis TaxID=408015 RepID=UPI0035E21C62
MTIRKLFGADPASPPPPIALRRTGAHLAVLRRDARLELKAAARAARIPPDQLLRAERGESLLSHWKRMRLLREYQATDQQREALNILLRTINTTGADWTDDGRAHRRRQTAIAAPAQVHRIWATTQLPSLLRTAPYARAVARLGTGYDERDLAAVGEHAQDFTAGRAGRAELLLDETVIRQATGSRAVMAGQLAHLLQLQDRGLTEVRVLPLAVGLIPHPQVVQLDYGPNQGRLAYAELDFCTIYHSRPNELDTFATRFEDVWTKDALTPDRSQDLVAAAIQGHHAGWWNT